MTTQSKKYSLSALMSALQGLMASDPEGSEVAGAPGEPGVSLDGSVTLTARIFKVDAQRQVAYGIVMEPGSPEERDAHGHWATSDDIYEAMYRYGRKAFKAHGIQHQDLAEGVRIIEMAQAPVDFEWEGPDGEMETVRKGTWYMGVYYPKELFRKIEKGEYTGFSIGATARILPDAVQAS